MWPPGAGGEPCWPGPLGGPACCPAAGGPLGDIGGWPPVPATWLGAGPPVFGVGADTGAGPLRSAWLGPVEGGPLGAGLWAWLPLPAAGALCWAGPPLPGTWPPEGDGLLLGVKPPPLDGDGPPIEGADGIEERGAAGAPGAFDAAGAAGGADWPGDWLKPCGCCEGEDEDEGEGEGADAAGVASGVARCCGCSVGGAA